MTRNTQINPVSEIYTRGKKPGFYEFLGWSREIPRSTRFLRFTQNRSQMGSIMRVWASVSKTVRSIVISWLFKSQTRLGKCFWIYHKATVEPLQEKSRFQLLNYSVEVFLGVLRFHSSSLETSGKIGISLWISVFYLSISNITQKTVFLEVKIRDIEWAGINNAIRFT